jgi:glycosyltransferase involved in cell wall biosynthesis
LGGEKPAVSVPGITFEIIVVDDASTDRTAEIARSFTLQGTTHDEAGTDATSSVRVSNGFTATSLGRAVPTVESAPPQTRSLVRVVLISAPPLPDNWTGKNNAMSAGVKMATGKWLLFTDADTVHRPGSLACSVAEAEQHGAALLSYSPEQEVRGFWENAIMPIIFAELAATYPPGKVNDPASPIAAANGQYLLISRQSYDAVGGHTKIAGDLLEDVALARLVKSSGGKILFRYGGDAVRTRMYRSWSQMKEGWTKNLALLFKHPVALAVQYLIESFMLLAFVSGIMRSVFLASLHLRSTHFPAADRYSGLPQEWFSVGLILLSVYLLSRSTWRVVSAHFPLRLALVSMVGPPVFAYLLVRSAELHKKGGVGWKGRTYHQLHHFPRE